MRKIRIREKIELYEDCVLCNPTRQGTEITSEFEAKGGCLECLDKAEQYIIDKVKETFNKERKNLKKKDETKEDV